MIAINNRNDVHCSIGRKNKECTDHQPDMLYKYIRMKIQLATWASGIRFRQFFYFIILKSVLHKMNEKKAMQKRGQVWYTRWDNWRFRNSPGGRKLSICLWNPGRGRIYNVPDEIRLSDPENYFIWKSVSIDQRFLGCWIPGKLKRRTGQAEKVFCIPGIRQSAWIYQWLINRIFHKGIFAWPASHACYILRRATPPAE